MSYWVVMLFDQESEDKIRGMWKKVCDVGVNTFMLDTDSMPHISAASCEQIEEEVLLPRLKELAGLTEAFALEFSSIGIFPFGNNVLFLAPVINDKLLALHKEIHGLLCEKNCFQAHQHYLPNHWTPHCTLAVNASHEESLKGISALLGDFQAFEVTVDALCVVEAYPIRYLQRYPLKGKYKIDTGVGKG
jgi:hypothetical protein